MTEQLLKGKYAVVTGGTRGIGRAIVERLLREGATVAFCGRTRENVERANAEMKALGNVFGYAADISKMEDVESFFANVGSRFPGVDVLVNNAGAGRFVSVDQMTPAEWRSVIDLNLSGVFYCCHHGLPLMKKRGGGYVINISSLAGKNPLAGGAAYNASKFGLNGFSEAIMMDLRYQNVRVSYVMPGSVDTEFGGAAGRSEWKIAPEDVADVVATLLRMPERTLISRVEMRPSRPPKK